MLEVHKLEGGVGQSSALRQWVCVEYFGNKVPKFPSFYNSDLDTDTKSSPRRALVSGWWALSLAGTLGDCSTGSQGVVLRTSTPTGSTTCNRLAVLHVTY